MLKKKKSKLLIGRYDIVDFPKLELLDIDIKIDSGAYTSSFHCSEIEEVNDVLKCRFLDPEHEQYHKKYFTFKNYKQKIIKSSNGMTEKRFLIKTEILLFEEIYTIELSLTERGSMKFPVLLGRKFLSHKFVIDSAKKNLSLKTKKIK